MARWAVAGETKQFLTDLYETLPGGFIEVRVRDLTTGEISRRKFCQTFQSVVDIAEDFGARKSNAAVYYGVAKRASSERPSKKRQVLGLTTLYADIDTGKMGWDLDDTMKAIFKLPGVLQPSALVASGGGIHAYWLLKEPAIFHGIDDEHEWNAAVAKVERVNKMLSSLLHGDPIHDITRVLRLPGTFNAKRKAPCECVYFYRWAKRDLDEMSETLADFGQFDNATLVPGVVLDRSGIVPFEEQEGYEERPAEIKNAWINAMGETKKGRGQRFDEIWRYTRLGGKFPYIGIDEACMRGSAFLHCCDVPDEGIIMRTWEQIKRLAEDCPEMSHWTLENTRKYTQEKIDTWKPKWAYFKALRDKEKREAKRNAAKGT